MQAARSQREHLASETLAVELTITSGGASGNEGSVLAIGGQPLHREQVEVDGLALTITIAVGDKPH